jgi:hypothetical protein
LVVALAKIASRYSSELVSSSQKVPFCPATALSSWGSGQKQLHVSISVQNCVADLDQAIFKGIQVGFDVVLYLSMILE